MKNEMNIPVNVREIVDVINSIGDAGYNEIYDFKIQNKENKDVITLNSFAGNGAAYHFYDQLLTILFNDNEKLTMEIKAIENSKECDWYYATKILITYYLNKQKYRIVSYLNGWNYDNLFNLTDRKYLKSAKHLVDEKDDIIVPFSLERFDKLDLFGDGQKQYISDIIILYLDNIIDEKFSIEMKVDEIIDNLSDKEIIVLKKRLLMNKK